MSDQMITVEGNAQRLVDAESLRVAVDGNASSLTRRDSASTGASVSAQRLDTGIMTVRTAARTAYVYCVRAARRFRWFITVKANAFAAVLESRVRAFLLNVFPKTGADILRQSAILNM